MLIKRALRSILIVSIIFASSKIKAQDSLAFGDKTWVDQALMVKIYFLQPGTPNLPRFDTMEAKGTLYAKKIDVPERQWSTGFPGVPDRNEWFAIVYSGKFKVAMPGKYIFRLLSDDGSKLYIDGDLLVDNDGQHPPSSRLGEIKLDNSWHTIRVEYFQGPARQIALQLFATAEGQNEKIFSSDNFAFATPQQKKAWVNWLIYLAAGLLLVMIIFYWIRRRKKKAGGN